MNAQLESTAIEKMYFNGPAHLSTTELLHLIVGEEAAPYLLTFSENNLLELGRASILQLAKLPKMTQRKAATLAAVLELGRRRATATALERKVVKGSLDVFDYFKNFMQDYNHEIFAVMFLNRSNKIIKIEVISSGGITGTVADPRIILKTALELNAVSMILSHNHPSGSLRPSQADEDLTRKIKEAAKYFDLKVLDHVIVSHEGYYSFADEGIL